MSPLARREVELLNHVRAELGTLRCDGQPVLASQLELVRRHAVLGLRARAAAARGAANGVELVTRIASEDA